MAIKISNTTVIDDSRNITNIGTATATLFSGSGASLTSLNASNLATGTVPDARISGSYTGMTNLTGSGTVDFAKFLGNAADTAAAPSYSWTSDTNMGMYRVGTDSIGWATNGVLRLTLNTTSLTSTLGVSAPTFTGALTGNATTATTLQTARTIALSGAATGTATSFNGSANITISVTALNASNLNAGTVPDARISGSYTGMTNLTGSGTVDFAKFLGNAADSAAAPSFSFTGDTNTGMYQPGADQLGWATAGVSRLTLSTSALTSTLNITAPTFVGALSGNATTATTLQTARTISLSGDATGSVSFNGSANVTIPVVVADNSHNHTSNTGNYTVGGDLTVSGGDIILSGTGRIQGIDTVSADTDAANKGYVDSAVAGIGATNDIFYENASVVSQSYTLTAGRNAMTAGPITINNGVTVTIPDGSAWSIV